VAQVIEHLPSKYEALSCNFSTTKKKKKLQKEKKIYTKKQGTMTENPQTVTG
jgi:hypothetical protein